MYTMFQYETLFGYVYLTSIPVRTKDDPFTSGQQEGKLIQVHSFPCPHTLTLETKCHTFLIISDKNGLRSKGSFQDTLIKQAAALIHRTSRRFKDVETTLQSVHLLT